MHLAISFDLPLWTEQDTGVEQLLSWSSFQHADDSPDAEPPAIVQERLRRGTWHRLGLSPAVRLAAERIPAQDARGKHHQPRFVAGTVPQPRADLFKVVCPVGESGVHLHGGDLPHGHLSALGEERRPSWFDSIASLPRLPLPSGPSSRK